MDWYTCIDSAWLSRAFWTGCNARRSWLSSMSRQVYPSSIRYTGFQYGASGYTALKIEPSSSEENGLRAMQDSRDAWVFSRSIQSAEEVFDIGLVPNTAGLWRCCKSCTAPEYVTSCIQEGRFYLFSELQWYLCIEVRVHYQPHEHGTTYLASFIVVLSARFFCEPSWFLSSRTLFQR